MNPGRNPIMIVMLNYIVGILISQGFVTPDAAPELVNMVADVVGLFIILATSLYSLFKYFQTHKPFVPPPVITPNPPVESETDNPSGLPPEMINNLPQPQQPVPEKG
jgi:hypothetical protein